MADYRQGVSYARSAHTCRHLTYQSMLRSSGVPTTATDNVTMSGWLNLSAYGSQFSILNGNGASNGWGIYAPTPANVLDVLHGGVSGGAGGVGIALNKWVHFVYQRISGSARITIDGDRFGSIDSSAPNAPGTGFTIGLNSGASNFSWTKEIAIWTSVLNRAELIALTLGAKPPALGKPMAAYYPLNYDLLDHSGNGFHLAVTGTSYVDDKPDASLTQGLTPVDFITGYTQIQVTPGFFSIPYRSN